ncbi:MAG: hypothetical protein RBU27_02445 [Bacteroidota bacterium]|jgi:hypothetical protein|nr:hypothetical protein [Bacteroidota bacterium]
MKEAERLRTLFRQFPPRQDATPRVPDPARFVSGVNERIDSRRARDGRGILAAFGDRDAWQLIVQRPAVLLSGLTAVIVLALAGGFILNMLESAPASDARTILAADDLLGLEVDMPDADYLGELSITRPSVLDPLPGLDDAAPATLTLLEEEIDADLLEYLTASGMLSAGFDYVSPYDLVDDIPANEFEPILASLELNRFTHL